MAAVILWMGVGSAMFTRRFEASTNNVLEQMKRPGSYEAGAPLQQQRPAPGALAISLEKGGNR
jgi:hypothetical protein